jgi:hypothetical protein
VSKFLENQKKLKILNIKSKNLGFFKYLKKVEKKTILEIKLFESDSNLDYMLKKLSKCPNLKRICFYDSNLYGSQNLRNVVFPSLEDLEIINCNFLSSDELPSPIIPFLINNGMNLMSIRLSSISDNQVHRFLLNIPQYCSNLVSLSVDIQDKNELKIFRKILKRCHNLKNVDFGNRCEWKYFVNEYIRYLSKIRPLNLRKLRVRYWKVYILSFERFFKNYGTFLSEFECSCTGEKDEIRTLVMDLVKKMNRTLVYLLIEEVEFQLISIVKVKLI